MPKDILLSLDKDERVVREIKRHPIGLIGIGFTAGLIAFSILVGLFLLIRFRDQIGIGDYIIFIVIGAFLSLAIIVVLTFISFSVYKNNELFVTNENIIQILQFNIFDRQISQLNLAKIQDVSVDQKGVLSRMFGYGTIKIETAGEQSNFIFYYAPEPTRMAKTIIEAHEEYAKDISGLSHSLRI